MDLIFVSDIFKMRKLINLLLLTILIISIELSHGKSGNIHKHAGTSNKKHVSLKDKIVKDRTKRSSGDNDDIKSSFDLDNHEKEDRDSPFWGNRGRRENLPVEISIDPHGKSLGTVCKDCKNMPFHKHNSIHSEIHNINSNDIDFPFWGKHVRRSSDSDGESDLVFWGNRGRRQDDDPFWATRGRRGEDEPFWGNRGRRDEIEPFWGNRGRRDDVEPFWGTRGRRQESEPFWGSRGRRNDDLKKNLQEAIQLAEDNIENLTNLKKMEELSPNSFWDNRGRNSQIKGLFQNKFLKGPHVLYKPFNRDLNLKSSPSKTLLDDRIFAEEPHFIIVERSGRSSAEEADPFYISRGKKKFVEKDLFKAVRDRRGSFQEIVKSVRNDPYNIARGKKDFTNNKVDNDSILRKELSRAKELICSVIELINNKQAGNEEKRENNDTSDRDRRTILKKLAAQLQIDPYFVSRGKKTMNPTKNDTLLQDFFNEITAKCDF